MKNINFRKILVFVLLLALVASMLPIPRCAQNNNNVSTTDETPAVKQPKVPQLPVPAFNADTAYAYVKKQVDFGPRVPNTPAHKKCAIFLVTELKRLGFSVIEQRFQAEHYLGTTYNGFNIIAQYKPEAPKRLMFAAHWDSRFRADKDTRDTLKPIDGADDGASGVGVLLEIARILKNNPVDVGVDLVLFDAEDNGDDNGAQETWCLGSQYWAKNPHKVGYMPYYAVLLDLVGAKGARFYKEGYSMQMAAPTVNKIWTLAASLGHGQYFVQSEGSAITDDHLFVARYANIPMVDIISTPNTPPSVFGSHHHTHADNMSVIDKNTLKAVGEVCAAMIYQVHNEVF